MPLQVANGSEETTAQSINHMTAENNVEPSPAILQTRILPEKRKKRRAYKKYRKYESKRLAGRSAYSTKSSRDSTPRRESESRTRRERLRSKLESDCQSLSKRPNKTRETNFERKNQIGTGCTECAGLEPLQTLWKRWSKNPGCSSCTITYNAAACFAGLSLMRCNLMGYHVP